MDFLTEHSESCNRARARRGAPRRAEPSRRGFQLNHVHALFTSHKRTGSLVPRHIGDVNDDDGTTAIRPIRPIRPDVVSPRARARACTYACKIRRNDDASPPMAAELFSA